MQIKTWRNPYDSGFSPTQPTTIELKPGLTVLVGCNGAGKTTLIHNINEELRKQNIPTQLWDNIKDGGHNAVSAMLSGLPGSDIEFGSCLWSASEGEAIKMNIARQSKLYNEFLKTGYYKNASYQFSRVFKDINNDEHVITSNQRWLLFDATDSGMSVDSICELKTNLFYPLITIAKNMNIELFIIISANEYELCRNEQCFDVNKGKYLTFNDYEDYRTFILNSRKTKEKRIEKQLQWLEKEKIKEQKQFDKLQTSVNEKIDAIRNKAEQESRPLTWHEKSRIDDYESKIHQFKCEARFISIQ